MSTFVEKRRHRRHTAHLKATAVSGNGLVRLSTTILNLSSGGAMIELHDDAPLGEAMTLLYGRSIEPCTIVWRKARRAGIRFDAPAAGAA